MAEVRAGDARRAATRTRLIDDVFEALEHAGFHQHDLHDPGGFHVNTMLFDSEVLVSWSARLDSLPEFSPYELDVEAIMQPAVLAILVRFGLEARQIPEDQNYAGYILVSGWARPSGPGDR